MNKIRVDKNKKGFSIWVDDTWLIDGSLFNESGELSVDVERLKLLPKNKWEFSSHAKFKFDLDKKLKDLELEIIKLNNVLDDKLTKLNKIKKGEKMNKDKDFSREEVSEVSNKVLETLNGVKKKMSIKKSKQYSELSQEYTKLSQKSAEKSKYYAEWSQKYTKLSKYYAKWSQEENDN